MTSHRGPCESGKQLFSHTCHVYLLLQVDPCYRVMERMFQFRRICYTTQTCHHGTVKMILGSWLYPKEYHLYKKKRNNYPYHKRL